MLPSQPQELRRSAVVSEAERHEHHHVKQMSAAEGHDESCLDAEREWPSRARWCKANPSFGRERAPGAGVLRVQLLKLTNACTRAAKRLRL